MIITAKVVYPVYVEIDISDDMSERQIEAAIREKAGADLIYTYKGVIVECSDFRFEE